MSTKIVTIVGARPQFIKAATVARVVRNRPCVNEILVHTGQHYDYGMSEVFFDELDLPRPAYNLGVGSTSHGRQTAMMLAGIEEILQQESPDWVLVYGDTNSTLAGALAAVKLHLPVAHVEAGLRSFNRKMPEEINREVTDHVSDLLCAPTRRAADQLAKEGLGSDKVHITGDVMFDASLYYAEHADRLPRIADRLGVLPKQYALATIHRAENTDDPKRLDAIVSGLCNLSEHLPVVLPLHPRTRLALAKAGLLERVEARLRAIAPVGYLEMIQLEKQAKVIVTDSGGVQKEAFFFHCPCITLRDETEWTELVDHGYNKLAGAELTGLTRLFEEFANCDLDWTRRLYGDGRAANHIVDLLAPQSSQV
jgi:UDP-GlcNAc3NAcA epimerase